MNHRHANLLQQHHMAHPKLHTNASNVETQPDQARAHMAVDDSTQHRVREGLEYSANDQDDWSLGIDNPADFGLLAEQYYIVFVVIFNYFSYITTKNYPPTIDATTKRRPSGGMDSKCAWHELKHPHYAQSCHHNIIPCSSMHPTNTRTQQSPAPTHDSN